MRLLPKASPHIRGVWASFIYILVLIPFLAVTHADDFTFHPASLAECETLTATWTATNVEFYSVVIADHRDQASLPQTIVGDSSVEWSITTVHDSSLHLVVLTGSDSFRNYKSTDFIVQSGPNTCLHTLPVVSVTTPLPSTSLIPISSDALPMPSVSVSKILTTTLDPGASGATPTFKTVLRDPTAPPNLTLPSPNISSPLPPLNAKPSKSVNTPLIARRGVMAGVVIGLLLAVVLVVLMFHHLWKKGFIELFSRASVSPRQHTPATSWLEYVPLSWIKGPKTLKNRARPDPFIVLPGSINQSSFIELSSSRVGSDNGGMHPEVETATGTNLIFTRMDSVTCPHHEDIHGVAMSEKLLQDIVKYTGGISTAGGLGVLEHLSLGAEGEPSITVGNQMGSDQPRVPRRATDGGVRLAGGRLEEVVVEDFDQDRMSDYSTLPPSYSSYFDES